MAHTHTLSLSCSIQYSTIQTVGAHLELGQAQITIFFTTAFFYDFTTLFYDFVTMLREHSLPYRPMFSQWTQQIDGLTPWFTVVHSAIRPKTMVGPVPEHRASV